MKLEMRIRSVVILIAIILAAWQLSYTWKYTHLTDEKLASLPKSELKKLHNKAIKLGLDLQGGMHLVLKVDMSKLSEKEYAGATDRALEILRNRVDQFGVSEPSIAKQGTDRIVIQIPGVVDKARAKEIIGKTAQLEFRLVERDEVTQEVMKKIDDFIYKKESAVKDTTEIYEHPLLSIFYNGKIAKSDTSLFNEYLRIEGVDSLIPTDAEFLWNKSTHNEGIEEYLELLLVKKDACLKGDAIVDANANIGTAKNSVGARVDLTMTAKARRDWARITESAPVVIERIVGGNSMIDMGTSPFKEAQDLALIIRAGALPAPVEIVEERSVGPSLGADSIHSGMRATYISAIIVLIFMIFFYAGCGLLADFALCFNIVFLLAILSAFKATLTLPGIAGIALVIGAAVDANILIFERIKEELRIGKTIRTAIDAGYARAFVTIIDANATTFLAGVILYFLGTGPTKGFGITLMIGIIANIFTAVFMTKIVLDHIVSKGVKKLSI
ncbi:MAG: protein translocase subunit SecD [Candidatus Stahlbacteria bacterium]|nr:protein translocase subunit SecD [Candidatus Stahlbacteria bacterium]